MSLIQMLYVMLILSIANFGFELYEVIKSFKSKNEDGKEV